MIGGLNIFGAMAFHVGPIALPLKTVLWRSGLPAAGSSSSSVAPFAMSRTTGWVVRIAQSGCRSTVTRFASLRMRRYPSRWNTWSG